MNTPIEAQYACVEREIRMRQKVYPRWVEKGRMTQQESDYELQTMRAVLETLSALREQQTLF